MGFAKLHSRALKGMDAHEVIVEVHVANGLPSFSIVGLPDVEVKESRDRVRSAIQMAGFDFPARRITVNLAPADLPKDSGRYDLPIALGILLASGLVETKLNLDEFEFAGELALDGKLRKISGALAIAYNATKKSRAIILSTPSASEASLIKDAIIYQADNLKQVIAHLTQSKVLSSPLYDFSQLNDIIMKSNLDFSQVKGQIVTKYALEVAASGRHSLLLIGNPGCGKSMLAQRLNSILPRLNHDQAIEVAAIYSLSLQGFDMKNWQNIPFRQPHHSSSSVAIVGGGSNIKPGEISLAHNGVLFLDEVAEFDKKVLEMLREPLETKSINIARATQKVEYPADFQLIAAMNPCPCGNKGHLIKLCKCSVEQINRYMAKLSAPFLDRIDLIVDVPMLNPEDLQNLAQGESSAEVYVRVNAARTKQLARQDKLNYALTNEEIVKYCKLDSRSTELLNNLVRRSGLSARAYYRMLKVARTIADIDGAENISYEHLAKSTMYKKSFH